MLLHSDEYLVLYIMKTNLEVMMYMVAYKCSTIVGLPLHLKAF